MDASIFVIPLVLAITLHEAAHGYAANLLGDLTAKRMGRVSLNPFRHVDAFGTIILPAGLMLSGSPFLFGWAKPVPVDFTRLRNPRRDALLVALAGPATNIILAFISALLLHLEIWVTPEQAPWLYGNLYASVMVNVVLAAFNMLPLLPLDGGRILNALLPPKAAALHAASERYGMLLIIVLFLLPALLRSWGMTDVNPGYWLIYLPADFLRDIILHAAFIGTSH